MPEDNINDISNNQEDPFEYAPSSLIRKEQEIEKNDGEMFQKMIELTEKQRQEEAERKLKLVEDKIRMEMDEKLRLQQE